MEDMNGAMIVLVILAVIALYNLLYAGVIQPCVRFLYGRLRLNIVAHKEDHKLLKLDEKLVLDGLITNYSKRTFLQMCAINFQILFIGGFTYLALADKIAFTYMLFAKVGIPILVCLVAKLYIYRAETAFPLIGSRVAGIIIGETIILAIASFLSGVLVAAIV